MPDDVPRELCGGGRRSAQSLRDRVREQCRMCRIASARLLHRSETVRIARKLDAMTALVAVVVSLTAICPCLPPATSHHAGQPAANEHACCASGGSPNLTAAAESCCSDGALTDRTAATPSAGISLSADTGFVAVVTWSPSAVTAPQRTPPTFVSSPPSTLRI